MEELAAIALFYSYIANGKKDLPDYTIASYIESVKNVLARIHSECDINEDINKNMPCMLSVAYDEGKDVDIYSLNVEHSLGLNGRANEPILYYSLSGMSLSFLGWLARLNPDLLSASLDKEALDHLNVRREDLPISVEQKSKRGEITIYSLREDEAHGKAAKCLEGVGYSDVSIGRGMPTQAGDKAYKFNFTGMIDLSSLNIYDKKLYEKTAMLSTILEVEAYKKEVLGTMDEDGKIDISDLFLSKTVLLGENDEEVSHEYQAQIKITGDSEALYNKNVGPGSDVTIFIDILGSEMMYFKFQGRMGEKKFERAVEEISFLSEKMCTRKASLEEIEEYINLVNEKSIKKELKPESK